MPPMALALHDEGETTSELTSHGIEHNLPTASQPSIAELDASRLITTLTTQNRSVPKLGSKEIASQKIATDHMITARWTVESGWDAPELRPYGPLSLMPTASCLHYATECFEGMKLYRGFDGKLRLFRPELNCMRMLKSTTRIALPAFNPDELLKLVAKLCATDGAKWLPKERKGHFLYIRPTMIATDSALGVERPKEALLYVMLVFFPPMDNAARGIKLLASQDDMVRAWPGGFGYAKVGANYGPSLVAQGEARRMGYDQILWLFGPEGWVTEAGASNFFVVWRTKEGKLQLITSDLDEKIVLDGITRKSVLQLAAARLVPGYEGLEPLEIVERKFTMREVEEAIEEGRLVEAFASGTAWFIGAIGQVHFRGKDLKIPMGKKEGEMGAYTTLIKGWLRGIMWGEEEMKTHEWGFVVDEE
ncbi:branched-chain amino acid aminotransferase II [Amniculicola lignicola CBS 123094]|uniref:Branched-chain-amino-acid aminotransferase n=1 Tax=Amniculicola lignicola CBS 123094 TaxID=1392246 RepID=A0A6A5W3M7_9PLEO|nr:branched-chain amino acid aminotransferase II [Amniculicola lignicola CBS 123094]